MRQVFYIYLLLVVILGLSSCEPSDLNIPASVSPTIPKKPVTMTPTITAILTKTPTPSSTATPPTTTYTPTPTHTATLTPLPTLKPEQAEETIRTLLRESVDCPAPCFWGIIPGKTTLAEARDVFAHLGLYMQQTNSREGKDIYEIACDLENGPSVTAILTIQKKIVENLSIMITPEKFQSDVQREWLAYSPETLIARYGTPSWVEFFVGRGPGPDAYSMEIYFDEVDLIVQYVVADFEPVYAGEKLSFRTCLLTDEIRSVRIWLGEDPEYPPKRVGIPSLEDATGLTLDEFAELMTGAPEDACIELKNEAFP